MVGNISSSWDENKELGDCFRDRRLSDLFITLHEHGTRAFDFHAWLDAERFKSQPNHIRGQRSEGSFATGSLLSKHRNSGTGRDRPDCRFDYGGNTLHVQKSA